MHKEAPRLDVVLVAHGAEAEEIAASVTALAKLQPPPIGQVLVCASTLTSTQVDELASGCPFPVRAADLTEHGALPEDEPPGATRYVAVLRAGDTVAPNAFDELVRDIRTGAAKAIYALRPADEYVLSKQLDGRSAVVIERDGSTAATWIGSPGFVLTRKVLRRCLHYDLTGAVGISSLFLEAVLHAGRFQPLGKVVTCGQRLEDNLRTTEACLYDPDWYHGLNRFVEALFAQARELHGGVPAYLQHAYLYLLQWRIQHNRNIADKMVLRADLPQFLADVGSLLGEVSNEILMTPHRSRRLDLGTRFWLLKLKGVAQRISYRYYADDIVAVLDGVAIASAAGARIDIEAMNIRRDVLRISGRLEFPADPGATRLVARYRGQRIEAVMTQRYADEYAFGQLVHRSLAFEFAITLDPDRGGSVQFLLTADGGKSAAPLEPYFRRPPSRLTTTKGAYWSTGPCLLQYRGARIVVAPTSRRRKFQMERAYLRSLRKSGQPEAVQAVKVRLAYFLTRWYYRKKTIWIYVDKAYKGGDNGEYAYRYATGQRDGIAKYYVLRTDVPDANRLRADGVAFVKHGSLRQKLLVLNADIVFSSQTGAHQFTGFGGVVEQYFRGLFRYRLVFLNHGVAVQSLANGLNRAHDNTAAVCMGSAVELENFSLPAYDYRPKQLVYTGLARFDGLVSNDKRQILIAPTWRRYLAAPHAAASVRAYSETFRDSAYCRIYNELINHPQLLAKAKQAGYRILLVLHPLVSSQARDFHGNELADVIASTEEFDYTKALTESSLMVTDYSGVAFDFAYMYKPVVYLHSPELPPSYDAGPRSWESLALGETCADVDSLVATIGEYLDAECALKDEFKARIDEFFYFHDRQNSARIYELGRRLQAR